ncbi:unnamed protein product [Candidula unifasciata]|uniref:Uncharacterized protein n=1 Tax=Candidula unifasciata TaxID=100452 RepID=A0A8S3ZAW8_9EUPU|nr:unnamed protein product [Candidula unifasciata]
MKMMDQNMASLAALEVASHMLYDNTALHMGNVLESDGDFIAVPYGITGKMADSLPQEWTSPPGGAVISSQARPPLALPPRAVSKPKEDTENNANAAPPMASQSDKKDLLVIDTSSDRTITLGVVTDPVHPRSGYRARKHPRDATRKHGKLQRNHASSFDLLTPSIRSSVGPARKAIRNSLWRLKQNSGLKSVGYEGHIPEETNAELIGNKAENNNWMLDSEEQSNTQGGLVVPTLHSKSCAPSFSSLIQQNSEGKPAGKAVSVENSSDELALSRQTSNVESDVNRSTRDITLSAQSQDGKSMTRPAETPDAKRVSCNAGVCLACGSDVQMPKCALCKQCGLRSWEDDSRNGPLDELKAYAQSFANSVKKILLNSPISEMSSDILHGSTPEWKSEENAKSTTLEEIVPKKHGPEIGLNRYMTEINMVSHAEPRSKSLHSKSLSYDGRVGLSMEEKGVHSSVHWINHDRIKTSDSLSKIADYRQSRVEGDSSYAGKEEKAFLVYEGDRNRISKAEKLKTKVFVKQLARVERARTDGDLRTNNLQPTMPNKKPAKDESKKGFEFQRNRSKTFHELEADFEDEDSCSPQREIVTDINICRLKVIHEGSPVDPPNTADCRKGDDGKGRKAMFIRSATAPYKNHLPRKEMPTSLTVLDNAVRANTKITVRTNKASTLRKENSLSDRRKMQDMIEAYADDASVVNSMSFTKRRSTSFDSSHVGPKRDDLHRSSSWSVIDGDEEESKHKRDSSPAGYVSIAGRNNIPVFSLVDEQLSRFRARVVQEYQPADDMSIDPFLYSELPVATSKEKTIEAGNTELSMVDMSQERSHHANEEQLQLMRSQNEYAFETERRYYDDSAEKMLSPCIEEEERIEDHFDSELDNESYYTEIPKFANQEVENAMEIDGYNDSSDLKGVGEEECVYHEGIKKYASPDISDGKNSPWYSPLQVLSSDDRSFMRRDRSLESKSTTSFHIVSMAKSSHSDEAITKYGGVLDHALSRRQSVYTETDVDTGLIYHLAKRQTTRAQVPNYHDLTSGSREIYTMSGDVSRSTSSNSAISTKSELSESLYTGGFYKDDPFYANDNKGSGGSSSEESSTNIYFESTGMSKRDLSEMDIYTGSIFNSNQNTMASSQGSATETANQENDGKDSRIMTSSRSGVVRLQRSVRCRPRADTTLFRHSDSTWGYLSQPVLVCGESNCYDVSNNSNNWYGMQDCDNSCPNSTIITKSADPMYTDYDPGTRPEFHVRRIEKSGSVFDFLKYDNVEETNKTFFVPPRRDDPGTDSIWYSGLLHDQSVEGAETMVTRSHPSVDRSPYSWQNNDDYYTSTVRPIVNKTNNCGPCKYGSIPCDSNNNHFEDIYTGSYGAQNVPPAPQEPAPPSRPPAAENWYVKPPTATYTSSTLYDQAYESCYTVPGPARRSASDLYEPVKDPYSAYSAPKPFRPEPQTASDSGVYMMDDGWWKYGPKVSSPLDEQRARRPEKTASGEPESYFNYASKTSPERNFYVIDDDTYSFEPKVESEMPEAPVVKEIKTVGGIVCRENVVNKDDYAEDINRDLEPGAWVPFTFRRDEDSKYPQETAGAHDKPELQRASDGGGALQGMKHSDDTYANNRLYDNFGARKNWQRPQGKQENTSSRSRDSSQHRAFQAGDTGRQDHSKSLNRNSSDIIPDKARGKRGTSNISKTTAENSCGTNKSSGSSNVFSRVTKYFTKWL